MSELARCPFCGGQATLCYESKVVRHETFLFYFVACDSCGASTRAECVSKEVLFDDEEWNNPAAKRAEAQWNQRKPAPD